MSTEKPSGAEGPVLWNISNVRNPNLIGRDALIDELRRKMVGGKAVQALHGLGGVGKTNVAVEYAYRYGGEYAIVWWVRADSEGLITASLMRLLKSLGREFSPDAPADLIRDSVRQMIARRKTLFIFDNAPDLQSVQPYLSTDAHVIITSRNPDWKAVAESQPVRVLKREDAVAFLRKRTDRNETDEVANRLAHALGDLPLALEQAAVYIESSKISFADYLTRFETQWATLLQQGRRPVDYPNTVAMTWGLSFGAVEAESKNAGDFINFIAFLNSDLVDYRLLRSGQASLPPRINGMMQDRPSLEAAMAALAKYSLVEANEQGVTIHRLVATVIRDRLDDERQAVWCKAAIGFLNDSFVFDSSNVASWAACEEWLPHVRAAAGHAERLDVAPEATAKILNDAGRYLLKRGQYHDAKATLETAMRIGVKRYGDNHPKISSIANNLGRAMKEVGEEDAAIEYFKQALIIDEAAYGSDHPHVAEVINNYGICLQKKGETDMARQQFEWAAKVYEDRYGPDAPKLAHILNNLGYALKSGGDTEGSRLYFLRALTIAEHSLGDEHPTVGKILYNLAAVHRAEGDWPVAKEHLERALAIDTNALGPNHVDVARDCIALADLLEQMRELSAAVGYRERGEHILSMQSARPTATAV